jgi:Lipocalin-like domain
MNRCAPLLLAVLLPLSASPMELTVSDAAVTHTTSKSVSAKGDSIVGTWILVGADKLLPDGTRVPDYGANPHGQAIFTADGYYSVQIYRSERLTFRIGRHVQGDARGVQGCFAEHQRPLWPLHRGSHQTYDHVSNRSVIDPESGQHDGCASV